MFSHIAVGVQDLDRAALFYDSLLHPLGLRQRPVLPDGGPPSRCWVSNQNVLPRFYVYQPYDGQKATVGNGSMIAFLAETEEIVRLAWTAGIAHGGTDIGPPGERPHYGPGYFGAYLRDPDGNKVHIVCRGDVFTSK